jgi:Bacterial Ig domain
VDFLTIFPNMVFETDVYLVAGDVGEARQTVYQLHQILSAPDVFAPDGAIDAPAPGATVSGVVGVGGWAFDDDAVSNIEITVDGAVVGPAVYGSARPDISSDFSHAPRNCGFSYALDTAKYSNGTHTLNARVSDRSGNIAVLPTVVITVSN